MTKAAATRKNCYGLMAEFSDADLLKEAARKTYQAGYRRTDAYSPFPIHGLAENLGMDKTRLPMIVLIAGILGCVGGFAMQYFASVINYPYNVGGRPLNSWPAFIPVCFEMTILFAAFAAVLGMLGLNGLPMPYHPVFNIERFAEGASRNSFFLCIESRDKHFDAKETRRFLESLKPVDVSEVMP